MTSITQREPASALALARAEFELKWSLIDHANLCAPDSHCAAAAAACTLWELVPELNRRAGRAPDTLLAHFRGLRREQVDAAAPDQVVADVVAKQLESLNEVASRYQLSSRQIFVHLKWSCRGAERWLEKLAGAAAANEPAPAPWASSEEAIEHVVSEWRKEVRRFVDANAASRKSYMRLVGRLELADEREYAYDAQQLHQLEQLFRDLVGQRFSSPEALFAAAREQIEATIRARPNAGSHNNALQIGLAIVAGDPRPMYTRFHICSSGYKPVP